MLSYSRLPASLSGIDTMQFFQYWNVIKNRIEEFRRLPNTVTDYLIKLGTTVTKLQAKGRQDMADLLKDDIRKTNDDLTKAWKVKNTIDKYLPEWVKVAESGGGVKSNLSALPIVLGIAAIAGLTFVVTTGMALVQDYSFKKSVTTAVIEKQLTPEAGGTILQVTRPSEGVLDKLGLGVGIGLPVLLLVGLVGYVFIRR